MLQGGGQLAELVGAEVAVAVGQVAGYIGDEGLYRAQQGVSLGKGEVAAAYLRLAGLAPSRLGGACGRVVPSAAACGAAGRRLLSFPPPPLP